MKKIVFAMAALLSTSAAFVSCSNNDVFEEGAAEQAQVAQIENQYKEAFVKHFGEVAPNQSWDFSKNVTENEEAAALTRGNSTPIPTFTSKFIGTRLMETIYNTITDTDRYPFAQKDEAEAEALAASDDIPVVNFPYKYAQVNLHPFYTNGEGTKLYEYNFLGITYKDGWGDQVSRSFAFLPLGRGWKSIVSASDWDSNWNKSFYIMANTTNMEGASNFNWYVATGEKWGVFGLTLYVSYSHIQVLDKCKIFYVNDRTYIAFDINGDKKYTDLICWVENLSPAKRYMVEDLGSIGDFDFNDIVFDVVRKDGTGEGTNKPAQYECLVRAMGGTLDFTLQLGKETVWSKSAAENCDVKKMYNTQEGDYDLSKVLYRFPVKNWKPELNDVTVTVVGKEGIFVLPYPEDGTIPYMVCTNIAKEWSKERIDVKTVGWFGSITNSGKVEEKSAE